MKIFLYCTPLCPSTKWEVIYYAVIQYTLHYIPLVNGGHSVSLAGGGDRWKAWVTDWTELSRPTPASMSWWSVTSVHLFSLDTQRLVCGARVSLRASCSVSCTHTNTDRVDFLNVSIRWMNMTCYCGESTVTAAEHGRISPGSKRYTEIKHCRSCVYFSWIFLFQHVYIWWDLFPPASFWLRQCSVYLQTLRLQILRWNITSP